MKEAAELQHFCIQASHKWKGKVNVVKIRRLVVSEGAMVGSYPRNTIVETGEIYTASYSYDALAFRSIVEDKLNDDGWENLKGTDEGKKSTVNLYISRIGRRWKRRKSP